MKTMSKAIFITLLSFLCVGTYSTVVPWPPKSLTYSQKLDHFSYPPERAIRRFSQRILYEDQWWKKNSGPIFFYCGNEGPIEGFWNNTGFQFELAMSMEALVIFAEHRFYGKSMPSNSSSSLHYPLINYLNVDQALADYVDIIDHIMLRFDIPKNSTPPVIAFGGSYGGMLAAYMRLAFPNKVTGALAASAPLYWVAGEGNFNLFFETIAEDYKGANEECPPLFRKAFDSISKLAQNGNITGKNIIMEELKLCYAPQTDEDIDHILRWARNAFVMMAMLDYPYQTKFMANMPGNPVNKSCTRALKFASEPIKALQRAIDIFYNNSMKVCFDPKNEYIQCSDITGCGLGPDAIAWDFQGCTQINLYDDANSKLSNTMFPYLPQSLSDTNVYCSKRFGVEIDVNVLQKFHRGGDMTDTSNIIFSNGNLDPWHLGGILSSKNPQISTFLIQGGAHHLDLRASHSYDPQSVKDIRLLEKKIIEKWVMEYNRN